MAPSHHQLETLRRTSSKLDSVPLYSPSNLYVLDFQMKMQNLLYLLETGLSTAGLFLIRPLSNDPISFLLSPSKMLLTLFVVQEWLDTRNASVVVDFVLNAEALAD